MLDAGGGPESFGSFMIMGKTNVEEGYDHAGCRGGA
jgi:hypothetical protein